MEKILLVTDVLGIIEARLTENLKAEDIAGSLFCSKSSIEKLFKYVTNMSIKDYIIRRRMSKAAKDMMNDTEVRLLELAVKYGYSSNEAFTRAFKSVWNINPSEYRKNPRRYELFPPLKLETELMEDETMRSKKKVDISELYDYIKDRSDCYFIGVDIKDMITINDISREAGDIAIITALNRLEDAVGAEDIVFRIGGDEFVAITSSDDETLAKGIVDEILSRNGETFTFKGREIPLNLYATGYRIENKTLKYSELFSTMQNEINKAK